MTREPLPRESILPVSFADLKDVIYRIDFPVGSSGLPILEVNRNLTEIEIREIVKKDPIFRALLFPAIVKEILFQILFISRIYETEGEEWQNKWLDYLVNVCGSEDLPEPYIKQDTGETENFDEFTDWINDSAVPAFCKKFSLLESMRRGYGRTEE